MNTLSIHANACIFINDTANVFITVSIDYMNRKDTPILMNVVKSGDQKDFSLTGLTIE